MAEYLAYRIAKGKVQFAQVPDTLKEAVKECLADLNAAHLAE